MAKDPEIEKRFAYRTPKEGRAEMYEEIRAEGKELAYPIEELCPQGRGKSLATTKPEESAMWANASIARS